jgi:prolyl 4-hydroxylase
MNLNQIATNIWTIDNFLSPDECTNLISLSENVGFDAATIETAFGTRRVDEVRNNTRAFYNNQALADELWVKLKPFAPAAIGKSHAHGLNELFRFYKYQPGQQFKKHRDGSYERNETEFSLYTFMVYLNDDYTGGETTFGKTTVKGQTGMALIFLHDLVHQGTIVRSGIKYILRTDIMFKLQE